MAYPVNVFNPGITPNSTLLWVGETSTSYLTLENDSVFKAAFKVASYVLTLGILPAIALVSANVYRRAQIDVYKQLCEVAKKDFDGAAWVLDNIDRFRITNPMATSGPKDSQERVKILPRHPKVDLFNHIFFAMVNQPRSYVEKLTANQMKNWATQFDLSITDRIEVCCSVAKYVSEWAKYVSESKDLQKKSEARQNYERDEKQISYSPYMKESLESFGITNENYKELILRLAEMGIAPSLEELNSFSQEDVGYHLAENVIQALLDKFKLTDKDCDGVDNDCDEFKTIIDLMLNYKIKGDLRNSLLYGYLKETGLERFPDKYQVFLNQINFIQD